MQSSVKEKPSVNDRVYAALQEDSVLMYHPENIYEYSRNNYKKTPDEISRNILMDAISNSDIYLIQAVHTLGFATAPMCVRELAVMKNKNPEKCIPAVDLNGVQARLMKMCQSGLLLGFSVNYKEYAPVYIYFCTEHAYWVMRKRLNQSVYGDNYLAAESKIDIFQKLAATNALLAVSKFIEADYVKGYHQNNMLSNHNIKLPFYGLLHYGNTKSPGLYIIAEPMFFYADPAIDDIRERENRYAKRLSGIERWMTACRNTTGKESFLILAVENMDGLRKAQHIVRNNVPQLERVIHYTTQNVLWRLQGEEKYGFIQCVPSREGTSLKLINIIAAIKAF